MDSKESLENAQREAQFAQKLIRFLCDICEEYEEKKHPKRFLDALDLIVHEVHGAINSTVEGLDAFLGEEVKGEDIQEVVRH